MFNITNSELKENIEPITKKNAPIRFLPTTPQQKWKLFSTKINLLSFYGQKTL